VTSIPSIRVRLQSSLYTVFALITISQISSRMGRTALEARPTTIASAPSSASSSTSRTAHSATYPSVTRRTGIAVRPSTALRSLPQTYSPRTSTGRRLVNSLLSPDTFAYSITQIVNPLGAAFNPSELNNLGCTIYQGITSGVYASLVGEANDKIEATITYLQQKLLPHFSTPYGCVVSNSSSSHVRLTDIGGLIVDLTSSLLARFPRQPPSDWSRWRAKVQHLLGMRADL
jgi:hypothetical protein